MSTLMRAIRALSALTVATLISTEASACTTSTTSTNLGNASSYAVATTPQQGSGSAGLQCDILLAALATHYVGLRVDASTFQLTGPTGQTIAYTAALTANGPPLTVGNFQDLSSTSLVSLFAGTNNSVPIYFRTAATPGLRAGNYSGFLDLRWYYSVCSLGVAVCLAHSSSPGFVRPILGPPTTWGSGVAVRVNVQLTVENDCIITAPNAGFGTAPLAGSFNPITRTILIRCSAGAAYTVGLGDGNNPDNGVRRMRSGSDYLRYEIYKTTTSPDRWGSVSSARRASGTADTNPGVYDSVTTQEFGYRAAILAGQATPPPGLYTDTILVDIAF
jgi:spore coat protein U-like protein